MTLLYFVAGLLPDPDGPFTPTTCNRWTWFLAAFFEVMLVGLDRPSKIQIEHTMHLDYAAIALHVFRITLLISMCALHALSQRPKPTQLVTDDAYQPLLGAESEHQPSIRNGNPKKASATSRTSINQDAQAAGWVDYFVGFSLLFPYIWWAKPFELTQCRSANSEQAIKGQKATISCTCLFRPLDCAARD